jgi:predicted secreted protein
MSSNAKSAKGTKLQIGDGAGTEVFTTIAEIVSVSGPEAKTGTIDVTSFDSTVREKISDGLVDGGEVSFEMLFVGSNAQQQALRTDAAAGTKRNFKLLVPDDTLDASKSTFAFPALVKLGPVTGSVGDAVKMNCTLEVAGAVTFTPHA